MLSTTRQVIAVALAAVAITTAPAFAASGTSTDARGEYAASLTHPRAGVNDARGEYSASAPTSAVPVSAPAAAPVVVEVTRPPGFDWTAAIIGMGSGLALAVLAGVGVTGIRHRPFGPSVG